MPGLNHGLVVYISCITRILGYMCINTKLSNSDLYFRYSGHISILKAECDSNFTQFPKSQLPHSESQPLTASHMFQEQKPHKWRVGRLWEVCTNNFISKILGFLVPRSLELGTWSLNPVSGETFGHHRSKSECFQVQPVTCCDRSVFLH